MSAGGTDPKVVEAQKESLTVEEKNMVELYQCWELEKAQPGIIQYMLDFGRNHLDLGPSELANPETEAEPTAQNFNVPPVPEEPGILERSSIEQPVARSLSSVPEETEEEGDMRDSGGASQPEHRVKPARSSRPRRIQNGANSKFASPAPSEIPSTEVEGNARQASPEPMEEDQQEKPNQQPDHTETDSRTVNGHGWIRLAPKIPSSMTPHSVPLQRQTTLQVVPGISQNPFARTGGPPAIRGAVRIPDSPPEPVSNTQPKAVRTVEQITLRRGVVINTEPLAVQIRLIGALPLPRAAGQPATRFTHPVNTRRQNNENREPSRRSVRRR